MTSIPGLRQAQLPSVSRIFVRHTHGNQRPKRVTTGFQGPSGHGERIYVFHHRRSDQVLYSFNEQLDSIQDLKQLPYNGKKTKPAKIRKDYWSPMARIQFPKDQGSVGRSVFQKLRELKHLHEVSWPDEFRYKRPDEFTKEDKKAVERSQEQGKNHRPLRTVLQRGKALNAQKSNAIADMAVVLAGQGRGNRMNRGDEAEVGQQQQQQQQKLLHDVTVSWFNSGDKNYAEEWSQNVTHEVFEGSPYDSVKEADVEVKDAAKSADTSEPQPTAA